MAPVSPEDLAGMHLALAEARAALAEGEVPVGAVVMLQREVLGCAHNLTVTRGEPMAHAEMVATSAALAAAGVDRLPDATIYVTLEPCAMCAGALVLAKVGRVVFGAWDEKAGMAGSVGDLLRHPRLNHKAEVRGGVLEAECGELLKRFFAERRD